MRKVLSRALNFYSIICKAQKDKNSRYFFTNITPITLACLKYCSICIGPKIPVGQGRKYFQNQSTLREKCKKEKNPRYYQKIK